MGEDIRRINAEFIDRGEGYILVVPGRLGSTDPWLGIPLGWPDISQARIIAETGGDDFRVEPSQGTHFFQNITSLGCGYLTINPEEGFFRSTELTSLPAESETKYLRVVQWDTPLVVKIEGKSGRALITPG